MKSKMLGALALLTLIGTVFVMQSANDQYTPTANAATGSIAALNVGTCLTTDDDVFKGDCDSLMNDANDWEVRDKITEVSTLYATYAHDPKTSSDEPRAILEDSDLIKISIHDAGRDKRSGVLVRGASYAAVNGDGDNDTIASFDEDATGSLAEQIKADLEKDDLNFYTEEDPDTTVPDNDYEIAFNSEDSAGGSDGIWMRRAGSASGSGDSIIASSGTHTLNFARSTGTGPGDSDGTGEAGSANELWQFDPGDFDVEDGAIVRFYGCVVLDTATSCNADGDDDTEDDIKRLKDLTVDEDRSNGEASGDTAPWLVVSASVEAGKDILILAIYYQTSVVEDLVGGQVYCTAEDAEGVDDAGNCPDDQATSDDDDTSNSETDVVFTDDEKDDNDALVVTARSDGNGRDSNSREVHLRLQETKAFSGRYEGYLRLTDANGDGRNGGTTRMDWGLVTKDATGDGLDADGNIDPTELAVLGVASAPVTIEYRDSDGKKQSLQIMIDKQPPAVNVTSPAHESASGDQSPDFEGNIEDSDSGLAADSFRLVVDNEVDNDGTNMDYVLNTNGVSAPRASVTAGTLSKVTHIGQYAGYPTTSSDTPETVGVTPASALYSLGDDSCGDQKKCHILAESYSDGAKKGSFADSIRLNLQDGNDDADTRDAEFEIDFQAFVMDMAGNIGFSDSDPANPRFINDLGSTGDDKDGDAENYVLGYYSAHIITLDEKDPVIEAGQSVTGLYGDSADRAGVKVVFDGPIKADSVSTNTFTVENARVVDVSVDGNNVYLKLDSELASDATPMIDIANGEKVEDMAGNETHGREVDAFKLADGISPRLTVTLSGGSGSGTGNEGPDKLTKDRIMVHVESDEELQSAPRIVVTCSSLEWNEGDKANINKDIDDYVANRNTSSSDTPEEDEAVETAAVAKKNKAYTYTCGYKDASGEVIGITAPNPVSSLYRPLGNQTRNWEHTWQKDDSLQDGKITVVAFASDGSRYTKGTETNVQNWGSASAEFTLDTALDSPEDSGDLQPAPDGESKEDRPFVLIEFSESTTVTLDSVELDGVEIKDQFEQPNMNRFVYWPLSMSKGEHEVEVEASDAAGNEIAFSYEFDAVARGDFVIELNAGWNAISVPANPKDTAISSVFTNPAVTTVIGWDTQGWRIAMRRDGVWESNEKYGALNEITAQYGYWVKSEGFVRQAVALTGGTSRNVAGTPILISIPTEPGWNFVGVIDQDGEQTEDDFDTSLLDSDGTIVSASAYLGTNYVRAYTWDATFSRFDVVRPADSMMIGDGVWVYYPEGTGIAP